MPFDFKKEYRELYAPKAAPSIVTVPPMRFIAVDGAKGIDYADKSGFQWTSVIRLPDFVRAEDFSWAIVAAQRKKKLDCSGAYMLALDEGLCVQAMHLGPYDSEPETVARMDGYLESNGYENDMDGPRRHHEIYISDPNKTPPEKRKTVIRRPIRSK